MPHCFVLGSRLHCYTSILIYHEAVSTKTVVCTCVHDRKRFRSTGSCSVMPNTNCRHDETVLSRRRRRCEHNSQLAQDDCRRIRSTIWKLTKQTP